MARTVVREIGLELGLSQSATEALLFRARQNVARKLDERTGVTTLQGLPLLSFLRNLFQTAAAKTAAIGAGAAIAVVAVPAAQPDARRSVPARPTVVHTVAPSPAVQKHAVSRHVARAPRPVAQRTAAQAGYPTRRGVTHSPPASEVSPTLPTAASAPPSVSPSSTSPPPSPVAAEPDAPQLAAPVMEAVDDLVGTTVAQVSAAVTPPAVETPTVPALHLP